MKLTIGTLISVLAFAGLAAAFEADDVARLTKTNSCVKCDLSKAMLTRQNLINANLDSSDLRNVDFSGSNLTDADLSSSDLTGANFSAANLTRTNFTEAIGVNLIGAILCYTTLPDGGSASAVGTCGWSQNLLIPPSQ
jgi:pentapeptide repeat protein